MSTAKFNTWQNPDGTENYKCRAWVNFNGTGTVAIRAAGNVSSITDNGTGLYTVNFTVAMPDANYVVVLSAQAQTTGAIAAIYGTAADPSALTVSGVPIQLRTDNATLIDSTTITAAIFR